MSDFEELDHYELLGVTRSASTDDIKRAYRREISKYHPDRFVQASPEEQEYASLRSQRLTEAYAVLSDFGSRAAYNRGQSTSARMHRPSRPTPPPTSRDHQSELYEQARAHLAAGRTLQAISALRQLQQINPFYRDSPELLAEAETQLQARQSGPARRPLKPLLLAGGAIASAAVAAAAAWAIGMRNNPASADANSVGILPPTTLATTQAVAFPDTPVPAPAPIPTDIPASVPTNVPAPIPTDIPTLIPTSAPTNVPTPTPQPALAFEQGQLLRAETFAENGWAETAGSGWQVGYLDGRYRIAVDPGIGPIWSYRTMPENDLSIGVDIQVQKGAGGLLLRFADADNYLSFSIEPVRQYYRLEQYTNGTITLLAEGDDPTINASANEPNRVAAILQGDRVRIAVNNQLLAEIDAPGTPSIPRFGLLAIARDTAAEALFDNLEIRAAQ